MEGETKYEYSTAPIAANWDAFSLPHEVLRGIYSYGFEQPSPIQCKALPPMIAGSDLLAQAQSGTGKTGAFIVGTLVRLHEWMAAAAATATSATTPNATFAILLAPTRELSQQIGDVAQHLAANMRNVRVQVLVGGGSVSSMVDKLRKRVPHLVVGCPGRVLDMLQRSALRAQSVQMLVLDEADELLSNKFQDQVSEIRNMLPPPTTTTPPASGSPSGGLQIAFFSATMSRDVDAAARAWMQHPVHISVKEESLTLEGIKQYFIALQNDASKNDTLVDIYATLSVSQSIIYCNTVDRVEKLQYLLSKSQFSSECIHSGMPRAEREQVVANFRKGKNRILISSDLTARGIDVQQVSVVINYDLPRDVHSYLHRIGRSGRWGRKGMAINFVLERDVPKMRAIEKYYNTQIDELPANFGAFV